MASKGLGTLTLDLVLRMAGFERGMDKAQRTLDKRLRDMDRRAKAVGSAIGVSLGLSIAGALTGAVAGIKSAIDNMDQLRDASIRLGIGTETLSALRYAAQQTGTDFETLGKGLKIFAKNAADALNPSSGKAQIFDALGIQVTDATGKLKQLDVLLPEVADKFKGLEDGTTKAALAQELFGKSGLELTEFLNQGSDGLKTMTDRARELGVVVGQDAADKADKFNDSLSDLKTAAMGLATQVANDLLPDLIKLTEWATGFVVDGKQAGGAAHEIANGFRDMIAVGKGFGQLIGFLEGVRDKLGDIQQSMVDGNWLTIARKKYQKQLGLNDDWSDASKRTGPIPNTPLDNAFTIPGLTPQTRFDATAPRFSAVGTGNSQIDQARLEAALAGNKPKPSGSGGGGSRGSGGTSEAQRDAEQLKAAYDSMNESLSQQIALYGQDGDAAKLRYELEHGELSKLSDAQKQELLSKQERLDLMRREDEQYKQSMENAQKDAEEKLRGVEATNQLIDDMRAELEMLGMTNKEREKAIALRYADKNATEEQKQAIADLSDQLYQAHEQRAFWDEFSRDLGDAFVDLATHAKSLKDAVKDFFDSLAEYVLRAAADHLAEKIASIFMAKSGTTAGASGSSGSGWGQAAASLIGSFFGGGKAVGGPTSAGMFYRVNENGPELLSVGGRDYLMMGSQAGHITPNHALAGATPGFTQVNQFNYAAPYDARVEAQKNARTAFETNRALQRNR